MSHELPLLPHQAGMTQLVLPNDTNQLGNLLGGQLMHWIDLVAAIAAARHSHRICVTASVDDLNFLHPIKIGEVVTLLASVNRVFRTSMEIGVKVISENLLTGATKHANTAYLTFVALDENGKPMQVSQVPYSTEEEQRRFDDALHRRELRLARRKKILK
ncbi:MAG: acyl-CoA thioesterase [Bacteriovoracaceae bacterium]|nr:acyl-CoA thioesterase [Bacteroidota bacterium]